MRFIPDLKAKATALRQGAAKPGNAPAPAGRAAPAAGQRTAAPQQQGRAPARSAAPAAAPARATAAAQPMSRKKAHPVPVQASVALEHAPADIDLAHLIDGAGMALTDVGGPLDCPPEKRDYIAVLDNGIMLVADSAQRDPWVPTLSRKAQAQNIRIRKRYVVDSSVVREAYEALRGDKRSGASQSEMQSLILAVIRTAAEAQASDIHLTVRSNSAVLEFRIDGRLRRLNAFRTLPVGQAQDFCSAAFNMCDVSDSHYNPQDYQEARISRVKTPELPSGVQAVRLQFDRLPFGGRYLIMRLISSGKAGDTSLEKLGFAVPQLQQITKVRRRPFGMYLVAGITGSGKSTTLSTFNTELLRENDHEINLVTVEDPPEYDIPGAKQCEVVNARDSRERDAKFNEAIRAILRSDPDAIMIGEIRDLESARLAVRAAMTGHFVSASIHATDAMTTLERLRDLGLEEYKIFDTTIMAGLQAQRLVRVLCPHCKVPLVDVMHDTDRMDPALLDRIFRVSDIGNARIHMPGEGCQRCRKGYVSRTTVAEVLLPDAVFMQHMRAGDKDLARQYWLTDLGGMTMLQHALSKMETGQVDPLEVERTLGFLDNEAQDAGSAQVSAMIQSLGSEPAE